MNLGTGIRARDWRRTAEVPRAGSFQKAAPVPGSGILAKSEAGPSVLPHDKDAMRNECQVSLLLGGFGDN